MLTGADLHWVVSSRLFVKPSKKGKTLCLVHFLNSIQDNFFSWRMNFFLCEIKWQEKHFQENLLQAKLVSLFQMWRSQRAQTRSLKRLSAQWQRPPVGALPAACVCLTVCLLTHILNPPAEPWTPHPSVHSQTPCLWPVCTLTSRCGRAALQLFIFKIFT